jgi:hypothetical protein
LLFSIDIPTDDEFIESEIGKKDRTLFFSYENEYNEILDFVQNNPPIKYSYQTNMEDEDWIKENEMYWLDGGAYGYKYEWFTYDEYAYLVCYTTGAYPYTTYDDFIYIDNHNNKITLQCFLEKHNLSFYNDDLLDLLGLRSDKNFLDRRNYMFKCIKLYSQYITDTATSIFETDLEQHFNANELSQHKDNLKLHSQIQHCIDNCSTCSRDTCILDNSE